MSNWKNLKTWQGTTFAIAILLLGILFLVLFLILPNQRDILTFMGLVVGATGAILSAIYLAQSVRFGIKSESVTRTIPLISRWNDPMLLDAKRKVGAIAKIAREKTGSDVLQIIEDEKEDQPDVEECLIQLLNILEELGIFISFNVVNEDILMNFYRTIVKRNYEVFRPWILHRQKVVGSRVYIALDDLYDRWKKK